MLGHPCKMTDNKHAYDSICKGEHTCGPKLEFRAQGFVSRKQGLPNTSVWGS